MNILQSIRRYFMTRTDLYFEAHVTIEPLSKEYDINVADNTARAHGFKLAKLLMQKRPQDTPERSMYDTFMTGHGKDYAELERRLIQLIRELKVLEFKVWRYKIENTIIDSRSHDRLKLMSLED